MHHLVLMAGFCALLQFPAASPRAPARLVTPRAPAQLIACLVEEPAAATQPGSLSDELEALAAIAERGHKELVRRKKRALGNGGRMQSARSVALTHLCRERNPRAIRTLLRSLGPLRSLKEYTMAIGAFGRAQDGKAAMALLDDMHQRSVAADVVCFSAAITACGRSGLWQRAVVLLDEMQQRGVSPNVVSFGAAIAACEKGGQWERALQLLEQMDARQIAPNAYCFNSAIAACEKGGQWERALLLLERMEAHGIAPDAYSFNSAISACASVGRWDQASRLLYLMERGGVLPDVISFSSAISACAKGGRWERALQLMKAMERRRIPPNLYVYNAAIRACGAAGQMPTAIRLFETLDGQSTPLEADAVSFNVMLDVICAHDRRYARALWRRGVQRGLYHGFERWGANGTSPTLDLHELSEGAAEVAVRWWIEDRVPSQLESLQGRHARTRDAIPLTVVTGWGRHRALHQTGDLRGRVEAVLQDMGIVAVEQPNPGVQVHCWRCPTSLSHPAASAALNPLHPLSTHLPCTPSLALRIRAHLARLSQVILWSVHQKRPCSRCRARGTSLEARSEHMLEQRYLEDDIHA